MATRKYKIAVVTPFFPTSSRPHDGRPTFELVKRLSMLADVHVVCATPRYPRWMGPKSFDYARVDKAFALEGVRVEYLEFPALPLLTRCLNGTFCAGRLTGCLRELAPDLILNYWVYPQGYAAVEVGRKLGVPTIVGAIGSDLNALSDPITRYLTRVTLQRAAAITCKSRALGRRAVELGADPAKVRAISNGCDTGTFFLASHLEARAALGVRLEEELVLFVGRLELQKGVLELVEAISMLRTRRAHLRLVFIGSGSGSSEISKKAEILGMGGAVRYASGLSPAGVAQWLTASDMLALPSYAEGCPNVILEAISSGRPVVATNVGGIPEIVDDRCAILVPPRDITALAQAIDTALGRKWDAQAIAGQFCRSWEDMAQETFELCVSNIEGSPRVTAEAVSVCR